MSPEQYAAAKRANDRVGMVLVLLFLVWTPAYLLVVRPAINGWLASYINSYPAMLHLIPIFGPLLLTGWLLPKIYPPADAGAVEHDAA